MPLVVTADFAEKETMALAIAEWKNNGNAQIVTIHDAVVIHNLPNEAYVCPFCRAVLDIWDGACPCREDVVE